MRKILSVNEKCSVCDGQGKCPQCKGVGEFPDFSNTGAKRKCGACYGNRDCKSCGGSGKSKTTQFTNNYENPPVNKTEPGSYRSRDGFPYYRVGFVVVLAVVVVIAIFTDWW